MNIKYLCLINFFLQKTKNFFSSISILSFYFHPLIYMLTCSGQGIIIFLVVDSRPSLRIRVSEGMFLIIYSGKLGYNKYFLCWDTLGHIIIDYWYLETGDEFALIICQAKVRLIPFFKSSKSICNQMLILYRTV